MSLKVKIKKLNKHAITPRYALSGDGCFDIFALSDGIVEMNDPIVFETGLAFEIPETHVMLIFSRSGQGFKSDTRLSNCVGVIDSGYRGEVKVKLACDVSDSFLGVKKGDAIAQAIIIERPIVEFVEDEMLSESERGNGGFGHTTGE